MYCINHEKAYLKSTFLYLMNLEVYCDLCLLIEINVLKLNFIKCCIINKQKYLHMLQNIKI